VAGYSVIQLGDLWDLVIGMRKLVQKPRSRIGREERLCIVITTMGIGGGYVDVNSLRDRVSRQNIEEIKVKS